MYRLGKEEVDAISGVINSRELFRYHSSNQEVGTFERELGTYMMTPHALAVSGGTQALIASLVGLGIGPGQEVIVPAYTFIATAISVLAVGAIPVIAEVDETLTIDLHDLERKRTRRTAAVIPVHMSGLPCRMDAILAWAKRHRIGVVEDACQAIGGSFQGQLLGTMGDAGAFSFNHYKIITAGEGGAMVCHQRETYERAVIYHDSGCAFRDHAPEFSIPFFAGTQARMSELAGAMLRVQLRRLPGILEDLRRIKRELINRLEGRMTLAPSHDPEGDCATTLALQFGSPEEMRSFLVRFQPQIKDRWGCYAPIDIDKHVYSQWGVILQRSGSHHKALNPYSLPENSECNRNYAKDMLPVTLEILGRTAYVLLHPDMDQATVDALVKSLDSSL